MIICSSIQNACMQPFVYPTSYESSYNCLLDGYLKSYDKMIEFGQEDVNKFGLYMKFDCIQIDIQIPKNKGES
tara:strand:+ start:1313 stop:1531 length:219 start_codon:yes stop_codon:yes gene_type:complete